MTDVKTRAMPLIIKKKTQSRGSTYRPLFVTSNENIISQLQHVLPFGGQSYVAMLTCARKSQHKRWVAMKKASDTDTRTLYRYPRTDAADEEKSR